MMLPHIPPLFPGGGGSASLTPLRHLLQDAQQRLAVLLNQATNDLVSRGLLHQGLLELNNVRVVGYICPSFGPSFGPFAVLSPSAQGKVDQSPCVANI